MDDGLGAPSRVGSAGAPGTGSFLSADPVSEHEALTEAAHAAEHRALTALRERVGTNGSSNGHTNGSSNGNGNGSSGNGHH